MKRTITFSNSAARITIPSGYYRDFGSPPVFQLVRRKDGYILRPLQRARKQIVCLPVKAITIRGEKKDYLQYILILPIKYTGGGTRDPVKIEAEVDWRPINGKLHGFIKRLTPGKTENRGRS